MALWLAERSRASIFHGVRKLIRVDDPSSNSGEGKLNFVEAILSASTRGNKYPQRHIMHMSRSEQYTSQKRLHNVKTPAN